jgi:hypothetical protein
MEKTKLQFTTLEGMYKSREFEMFISDKLGNDLFISDPERAERMQDASEDGIDGSTHAEIIEDWREFLDSLRAYDPDFHDIDEIETCDITLETKEAIEREITACEKWHKKNRSLHKKIG